MAPRREPDDLPADLARLAVDAPDQGAFRDAALARVLEAVPADIAFFHALNPRVPLESAAVHGIELAALGASVARWDQYAVELARWREAALARGGVAVDTEVFTARERERLGYFREFARALGIRTAVLAHLQLRGRLLAAVALFRTRTSAGPFAPRELDALRAAVPVLTLGDVAQGGAVVAPLAEAQRRPVCVDQRLSARQREIVGHVALGHTNAEIARALGASPNTVRNQLAAIFRVLGAANRAEVVRVAVLR